MFGILCDPWYKWHDWERWRPASLNKEIMFRVCSRCMTEQVKDLRVGA